MKLAFSLFFLVVFVSVTLHVHEVNGAANISKTINVNLDGTGDFKTIQEAINSVPTNNSQWIRVHVSAGVYSEKVNIQNDLRFILLEGDGRDKTLIEWGDYAGDPANHSTYTSATFTSRADHFVAKNITFKNSATAVGQAVAAVIHGNHSAFYGCGFIGVQDTLYDQGGLHYFKECYIEGATDFIFGNGQSIYEGCALFTVQRDGVLTAQSRESPTEENGFVFKYCNVGGTQKANLGRAWRNYARVIFYETFMSDIVNPEGWDAWNGKEEDITFVESSCSGPGSNTSQRVKWMKELSPDELKKFTDMSYIDREGWINAQP
ncbi:putative pectinesterase 10 [Elaeis guineensis]|uniref:putative pectinesterase 10 n=1 Tax=Elaeis guineensis var. tenera TaxID=51953 RepID=UPI003C6DABE3